MAKIEVGQCKDCQWWETRPGSGGMKERGECEMMENSTDSTGGDNSTSLACGFLMSLGGSIEFDENKKPDVRVFTSRFFGCIMFEPKEPTND